MAKHVLIIATSADKLENGHATGLWLEEFAAPYLQFEKQGYKVTVASIEGGDVPIDANSLEDGLSQEILDTQTLLKNTVRLDQVADDSYDAVFLPGGHGTVVDFPDSETLQRVVRDVYESGNVVAAVCHGPIGLVNVTLSNGEPLVKDKQVTGFTDAEEREMQLESAVPFLLESALREKGGKFDGADNWAVNVAVDERLVTGQNPQSSERVAEEVVKLLN
ncbi:MAG: type 1 glutamine amidotransferase domain-containing protein [Exiguobacterium sp.]|uniref:Type 1 glutamine amidotransferase domain-containing protein n=1 Tax=Exiguobacterium alkaliphilum TaxID=1428684 RepID=A0ABT2L0S5_9BACL|nr:MULTISPECIES: type 1 glutamine amidotransferase domain-containing protein [Exiguobacterium]MDX5323189.1 type 1 glutamine amidotransferase domain-containing protein [Exiguobacterium sp.]KDN57857.1 NonF [Exiguobacterium sp. AB2]MCT4796493.1 type 1 glutamine amidotransferase domain-containing protein [Exiguobacterium alkaliphilum]MDX5424974.1 type 1 glutamine amidotransferase domain-containing protein [Exiguobacterium sp.]MDX6772419.1 type 1 glutamine amidotransferase domain-containing protein